MPPIALLVTRRRSRAGRQFESQEHEVVPSLFLSPLSRCCRLTLELAHTDAKPLFEQMIRPDRRFASAVGAHVSRDTDRPRLTESRRAPVPTRRTARVCLRAGCARERPGPARPDSPPPTY